MYIHEIFTFHGEFIRRYFILHDMFMDGKASFFNAPKLEVSFDVYNN